uniref:Uncharacterized protein n=1 Tax=Romanomermis culicivorax TaxID=13658 RepID=A0A915HIJ6_ROMCU
MFAEAEMAARDDSHVRGTSITMMDGIIGKHHIFYLKICLKCINDHRIRKLPDDESLVAWIVKDYHNFIIKDDILCEIEKQNKILIWRNVDTIKYSTFFLMMAGFPSPESSNMLLCEEHYHTERPPTGKKTVRCSRLLDLKIED